MGDGVTAMAYCSAVGFLLLHLDNLPHVHTSSPHTSTMAKLVNISSFDEEILRSVVGMLLLTFVVFIALYATRLPAMNRAKIDPQQAENPAFLKSALPASVRCVADNYNHLFEAPVAFYAICLVIVLLGHSDALHAQCAKAYLFARIAHSAVQCTFNKVVVRFLFFVLSWVALGVMITREAVALLM